MKDYKVAIVDDNPKNRERTESILLKIAQENNKVLKSMEFSRGKTLLYELQDGNVFDIFILDIEMPEMDGMELAKYIRANYPEACIIFATSYSQFALESYEVDAYQYILKEKLADRLPKALKKFFGDEQEDEDGAYYTIETIYRTERFRCKDIVWIYKDEKNVIFVTAGKRYRQRTTLGKVFDILPQEEFIYVERGIIVNLRHICGIVQNVITLSNGEEVVASRAYVKSVRESITRYWGKRL